ncbi:MAG TPA: 2-C-methyl-D-erythritol 4-phosphate cytidylyltransferase [bacterium]
MRARARRDPTHRDPARPRPSGRVAAIVPAAGEGRRLGGRTAKPFVRLAGRPILAHVLRALERSSGIACVIPVVRPGARAQAAALIRRERLRKTSEPVEGGPTRAASIANGFAAVPAGTEWVLIHDAARPCLTPLLTARVLHAARRTGAAACGLPAALTVKAVDERREVRLTLDRDHLWFVQTPQAFRRDWYEEALAMADDRLGAYPDDASLLEAAGFPVRMVPGDPLNLKITTREDLMLAEAIFKHRRHV